MRKTFSFFLVWLCLTGMLWANDEKNIGSDKAGDPVSMTGIGIQSSYRSNFLRLGYSRMAYRRIPTYEVRAIDAFHTIEWEGQFTFKNRFRTRITIPYERNVRKSFHEVGSFTGLSDVRITVYYDAIKGKVAGPAVIYGSIGMGVSTPTGLYDPTLRSNKYPEQFNVGSDTWSIYAQPVLQVNIRNAGIIVEGMFKNSSKTNTAYEYGDQWSMGLTVFYQFNLNEKWSCIPFGGWLYEHVDSDYYLDENVLMATPEVYQQKMQTGLTIRYSRWSLATSIAKPLSGSYLEGVIHADNRVSVQLIYII